MKWKHQSQRPVSALTASLVATMLISLAMPLVAADASFPIVTYHLVEIISIEGLPMEVRNLLGRQKSGVEGIANKWSKFNATDVIDSRLPMRRFITGGASADAAIVAYEQGGIGYSIRAAAFALERSGWVQAGEWTLHEKPNSLRELLELVDSKHYPKARLRPVRREGPLRELNITDDEIREIQAATREIFPGAIVNISGVVAGCPCEEGAGCSDQVWVVAHRTGRSEGLQLSRVNGHWAISVVQRWWLDFDKVGALRAVSPKAYATELKNLYDTYPACRDEAGGSTQAGFAR